VVAGAIAMPVGALLAIPAIRLSGLYLAPGDVWVSASSCKYMFYTENFMFGSTGLGVEVPMAGLPGSWAWTGATRSFYYLCLVLTVLVTGIVIMIGRSASRAPVAGAGRQPAGAGHHRNLGQRHPRARVLPVRVPRRDRRRARGGARSGRPAVTPTRHPVAGLLRAGHHHLGGAPWYALTAGGRADESCRRT